MRRRTSVIAAMLAALAMVTTGLGFTPASASDTGPKATLDAERGGCDHPTDLLIKGRVSGSDATDGVLNVTDQFGFADYLVSIVNGTFTVEVTQIPQDDYGFQWELLVFTEEGTQTVGTGSITVPAASCEPEEPEQCPEGQVGTPPNCEEPEPEPEETKPIAAKALDDYECNAAEWHFVINQLRVGEDAPASINVTWANGQTETVPLDKVTGKVAHYATASNLDSTVTSASAEVYSDWNGQFNLSHGPCEADPEEPTEPEQPEGLPVKGSISCTTGIVLDKRVVRVPAGTVVKLGVYHVAENDQGRTGMLILRATNNPSIHPGNNLVVTTGGKSIVFEGVEDGPSMTFNPQPVTLGAAVSVAVVLGSDEAWSAGFVLTRDCDELPPPPPVQCPEGTMWTDSNGNGTVDEGECKTPEPPPAVICPEGTTKVGDACLLPPLVIEKEVKEVEKTPPPPPAKPKKAPAVGVARTL